MQPTNSVRQLVQFGAFHFDAETGELLNDGIRIRLQDKPLQILLALIEKPGEVLSREDLRRLLWGEDIFVDFDNCLNVAINRLRDALGDTAENARYIETVPRRGYRFVAPVRPLLPETQLASAGGPIHPISQTGLRLPEAVPASRLLSQPARMALLALLITSVFVSVGYLIRRPSSTPPSVQRVQGGPLGLDRHATTNAEAFDAFVRGRYHWSKRSPADMKEALRYFQVAIEKDGNYALAYAGMADCYLTWGGRFAGLAPNEAYLKAEAAAQKAIELDPSIAEAYATLAGVYFEHDRNVALAEQNFRKALELNPGYAVGHQWYAEFLATYGRNPEAFAEIQKALILDPQSRSANLVHARLLLSLGEQDRAIETLHHLIELDSHYLPAYVYLARASLLKGESQEFLMAFLEALRLAGVSPRQLAEYQRAFHAGGVRQLLEERLRDMESSQNVTADRHYALAITYAVLGEYEKTYQHLERVTGGRTDLITSISLDPELVPLRAEPRFREILRRLGIPNANVAARRNSG